MAGERAEHQVHLSVALILWSRMVNLLPLGGIVLGRRPNGRLTFVGGGVERGETLVEALAREFLEETGTPLDSVTEWVYFDRIFPRIRYNEQREIKSIGFVVEALLDRSKNAEFLDRNRIIPKGELASLEVREIRELTREVVAAKEELFDRPEWNRRNLLDALKRSWEEVGRSSQGELNNEIASLVDELNKKAN